MVEQADCFASIPLRLVKYKMPLITRQSRRRRIAYARPFLGNVLLIIACVVILIQPFVAAQTTPARTDQSLDGSGWRLGSFNMGDGTAAHAYEEQFDDSKFRKVAVPGEVQLQMGLHGMDRFYETKELIGVNLHEWWYRTRFRAPSPAKGKQTRLVFNGADYFATVWLNGHLLGEHEGPYVPFSYDVTSLLRDHGDNVLAVRVSYPWVPKGRGLGEYMKGNYTFVQPSNITLKDVPYSLDVSWDALPADGNAAFGMGLWRGVHLVTSNLATIADLHVLTESLNPDGSASLSITGVVENADTATATEAVALSLAPANFDGPEQAFSPITLDAVPGKTSFNLKVRVDHPHLWWTWDTGKPEMYNLTASLVSHAGERQGDRRLVRFGIRTITRAPDMTYRLNGKRLFIKGSWFPIADFYGSQPTHDTYERDLRLFRDDNLNLLVNFTVVEKPAFYDLCDELGILEVVELPFPQLGPVQVLNADSPRRKPYLAEAAKEVTQIVIEHRNHPSIIQWAPLAEAHEKSGGWGEDNYRFDQGGYDTFSESMKSIINTLAPDTIFHPSLCDLGEQHFWMGAAGQGGNYQDQFDASTGFVSEYGSMSMSSYEDLGKYLTPQQQWGWQKDRLLRWYGLPIDLSAYAYLTSSEYEGLHGMLFLTKHFVDNDPRSARELVDDTQLYQAFLMKYATESYRRKQYDPIMGVRFWDFVELAPGFHFGVVDYDRVPKIAYWYMKRAQAQLAVSFAYKKTLESQVAGSRLSIPIWAVNDLDHEIDGKIECKAVDLRGNQVGGAVLTTHVPADGKTKAGTFDWILPKTPGVYVLRESLLSSDGRDRADNTTFVKVVPPAFARAHRVLLIGENKFVTPIAAMLRSAGLDVNVYDQDELQHFTDFDDGSRLHSEYSVIWLADFASLAKVLDPAAAKGLGEAVRAGTGFIHTGGYGSYHGGGANPLGHAALVEATALADILPVTISNRDDLVFGGRGMDDAMASPSMMKEIHAAGGGNSTDTSLLQHYGLPGFNLVTAKSGSRVVMTIYGSPLLVTGRYGQGRTVAFTGFTPAYEGSSTYLSDEQMVNDPINRAYFSIFITLIADAVGERPMISEANCLAVHEKPLFQTLKEQPSASVEVQGTPAVAQGEVVRETIRLVNGAEYARLVRLRAEWDAKGPEPYTTEFSDNAFDLLPHEEKNVVVEWRVHAKNVGDSFGRVIVDGVNLKAKEIAVGGRPGTNESNASR